MFTFLIDNLQAVLILLGFFSLYLLTWESLAKNIDPNLTVRPSTQQAILIALFNVFGLTLLMNRTNLTDILAGARFKFVVDENLIVLSAFVFIAIFIFSHALVDYIRQKAEFISSAGLGFVISAVLVAVRRSIDFPVSSVFVVFSVFIYLFMMSFSTRVMDRDDKHRAPLFLFKFNPVNFYIIGFGIALGGVMMIRVFGSSDRTPLLIVFAGFVYVYALLFTSANAANHARLYEPKRRSTSQIYSLGLAVSLPFVALLGLAWQLGASSNFVTIGSLLVLYIYIVGDNFYQDNLLQRIPRLNDYLVGSAVGFGAVILIIPFAIYYSRQEMSTLVRGLALWMSFYLVIALISTVESAFIKRKYEPKWGAVIGGSSAVLISGVLMFITVQILKSQWYVDVRNVWHEFFLARPVWLQQLTNLDHPKNVLDLLGVVIVIGMYSGVGLLSVILARLIVNVALPQKGSATITQRSFVFYSISAFLMAPFEMLLTPIQIRMGNKQMAYLFILPNMLIFGVFILMPMLLNFYFGFTDSTSFSPEKRWADSESQLHSEAMEKLVICDNYGKPDCGDNIVGTDFWRAVPNTFKYVAFQVISMVILALITAIALNQQIVARGFFRSIFFFPVLLSPVVIAYIWLWILDSRSGLINSFLVDIGLDKINFVGHPDSRNWSFFWVIFVADWAFMGFYTLILLAGLQAIPRSLYEAASIDGANSFQQFFGVTLPLLMPTMTVVLVLALIRAVQAFDHIFVLTGGGPGSATTLIVQFIYKAAFESSPANYGVASSASLLLAIVLFLATMAQLYFSRRGESV